MHTICQHSSGGAQVWTEMTKITINSRAGVIALVKGKLNEVTLTYKNNTYSFNIIKAKHEYCRYSYHEMIPGFMI
jgi:hypothetical protein